MIYRIVGIVAVFGCITAAFGWDDITKYAKAGVGSVDNIVVAAAPCPRGSDSPYRTYHCSGKPPLALTHCCNLGEWFLNDGQGTLLLIIFITLAVISLILSIFCCQCYRRCPGNLLDAFRTQRTSAEIQRTPTSVYFEEHESKKYVPAPPLPYRGYTFQK